MNGIGNQFAESFKIILTVLGIISAYPVVSSDNFFVYRNLKDPTIINGQFRCGNLINSSLQGIIDSGIPVYIVYDLKSDANRREIYKMSIIKNIHYDGTNYFLNSAGPYTFNIMTNILSVQEFVFLTNADLYAGIDIETEVKILISCDMAPEIVNLWGNKPKVVLNYNFGSSEKKEGK